MASETTAAGKADTLLGLDETRGRWVLFAAVLGSGIAMIDGTVVNIALPTLGRSLHGDFGALQWTVNGYTLTLASFILLGGSFGDRFGRRRVFMTGVTWFGVASLVCGLAQNIQELIAARMLQGIGGALLTPGSLALISASFRTDDRGRAIGAWSGLGGIASAAGPLLGGLLVPISWRLVFLINLPLCALVIGRLPASCARVEGRRDGPADRLLRRHDRGSRPGRGDVRAGRCRTARLHRCRGDLGLVGLARSRVVPAGGAAIQSPDGAAGHLRQPSVHRCQPRHLSSCTGPSAGCSSCWWSTSRSWAVSSR